MGCYVDIFYFETILNFDGGNDKLNKYYNYYLFINCYLIININLICP